MTITVRVPVRIDVERVTRVVRLHARPGIYTVVYIDEQGLTVTGTASAHDLAVALESGVLVPEAET